MKPKILVLMATYNGGKYLREQLDSVFLQKNVDITVLVRDDGSIDNTCAILDEYSKRYNLIWYSGQHLNVANGFYNLMEEAVKMDFDYFAFCDQDDVWDTDKLSIGVSAICSFNEPALYYSGQRLADGNLNFIANHELNTERTLHTRFILSDFAGCTGVFNKSLLKEVVSYRPKYMLMHDTWILKVCLALGGQVIIDTRPHMYYRQHGGNTVGLGRSLSAYFKQVKQYITEYKVEPQMKELLLGYGDRIISEYAVIANACCNYKTDREARTFLLNRNNVDFCTMGLNITFKLKVLLNKL